MHSCAPSLKLLTELRPHPALPQTRTCIFLASALAVSSLAYSSSVQTCIFTSCVGAAASRQQPEQVVRRQWDRSLQLSSLAGHGLLVG